MRHRPTYWRANANRANPSEPGVITDDGVTDTGDVVGIVHGWMSFIMWACIIILLAAIPLSPLILVILGFPE